MFRVCVGVALVCSPSLVAQDAAAMTVSADATVKIADVSNREAPPPVTPVSQTRVMTREAPAGVSAPGGTSDAWFGVLDAGGRKVGVVVAEEGSGHVLFLDRNADGKFGDGEKMALVEETGVNVRGESTVRADPLDLSLSIDGREVAGSLVFSRSGEVSPQISFQTPSYLEASVDLDGKEMVVAVLDEDLDGRFGSEGDAWTMGPRGQGPARIYNLNAMTASMFNNGQRYAVGVDGDAVEVTVTPAEEPDPASEVANRKRVDHYWVHRFDLEREQFIEARGVDTSRPRDKSPIAWNYVTFDEGLAMAKKSGKLLFADAMAFWCVWCYRLDYYTYPDDEVAALMMEHFIPVKIIDEQNRVGDFQRMMGLLEARGIPAMGIFDGDGNLVHKISGWKPAQAFVEDLKAAISNR